MWQVFLICTDVVPSFILDTLYVLYAQVWECWQWLIRLHYKMYLENLSF